MRLRADERPMRVVLGALFDPSLQDVLLGSRERTVKLRRRHDLFRVSRDDPMSHRTFLQIARDNRDIAALKFLSGTSEFVQTEARLAALIRIWSVTAIATIGQNRTNLPIEVDGHFGRPRRGGDRETKESERAGTHGVETLNFSRQFLSNG